MINLRTLAALAPVGGGVWLVMHPGLASTIVAAGTIGAAVVQHSWQKQKAEREAKAVEEAKAKAIEEAKAKELEHDREVAEFMAQNAPQALPKPAVVIDYTQAGQAVTRRV